LDDRDALSLSVSIVYRTAQALLNGCKNPRRLQTVFLANPKIPRHVLGERPAARHETDNVRLP
jgi:hypothetical protein